MNDLIAKLYDQSIVVKDHGDYVDGELDPVKFAELIVRECLAQSDKMRDSLEQDGENEQALGADWAGLAIARHFGVE